MVSEQEALLRAKMARPVIEELLKYIAWELEHFEESDRASTATVADRFLKMLSTTVVSRWERGMSEEEILNIYDAATTVVAAQQNTSQKRRRHNGH